MSLRSARRKYGLAVWLCVCLGLAGCGGDSGHAPPAASAPAGGAGPGGPPGAGAPVAVLASPVAVRDFNDHFTALGTAHAAESIDVTSRISSIVDRIHFSEGQQVPAGQLLVELDNKEARADVAVAEASLRQSRSQFERSRQLADTRIISASQLDEQEAKLRMDEASLQAARARLDNHFIRAPFAGTLGLRRVSPGDLVGPQTVITTLDDTRSIRLEFTVPEHFLSEIRGGMQIKATSAVYPGRLFAGAVANVDSRVDPVTRSIIVVARLPNPERALKPGMFLSVELERERRQVLMVPEEALSPRAGKQYVYLVQDGHAVEREVQIGTRAPGLVEIRAGLTAGDVVVTEGTQSLRDGAAVQVLSSA
jgi:membrane fusion protein, multidrug efflux system